MTTYTRHILVDFVDFVDFDFYTDRCGTQQKFLVIHTYTDIPWRLELCLQPLPPACKNNPAGAHEWAMIPSSTNRRNQARIFSALCCDGVVAPRP